MTKRIILHIGMPKCATTSLQAFLARNRKRLAAHGFRYDQMPGAEALGPGNAGPLALAMLNGDRSRIASLLAPCLRQDRDVILSSEDFYGLARSRILIDTVASIRRAGFEVGVICFVRRQDLWIESDYKQHVQSLVDWRGSINELLIRREESQVLNYNAMLRNWARSVGRDNILAIPLHRHQPEDHVLRRFFTALSIADIVPDGAADTCRRNVSSPAGLIEPARYLKKARLEQGGPVSMAVRDVERFLSLAARTVKVPSRKFLLSAERRARLVARYRTSNDELCRSFMSDGDAFSEDVEYDAASETVLAAEAAEVLAAYNLTTGPAAQLRARFRRAARRPAG